MKKITLLLMSLFAGFLIRAQTPYSFNICGYVTSTSSNTPAINATIGGYISQGNGSTIGQFSATTDSTGNYCTTYFTASPDTTNCAFLAVNITASIPGCNSSQTFTFNYWLCNDTTILYDISGCDTTVTGCSVYISDSTNFFGSLSAWGSGTAPFTYQWSNGNGTIYDTTQYIYPTTYGQYCVSVTDANGCIASDCYYYGQNSGSCYVSIYQYSDSSTGVDYLFADFTGGTPVSYQWQGNGSVLDTTDTYYPNAPGQYCVTVVDDSGCSATACYDYGQNTNQCYVYFSSYEDSSNAGLVYFYAYPGGTAPFVYSWSFSDGTADTSENPVHTFIQSNGWDYACLEITDATGCVSSYCDYVYTSGGGTVVNCYASFSGYFDDVNGTPGEIFFTDYSWGGNNPVVSWNWDFGDGASSTLQNPSHIFSSTGNYTICLTIADGSGCSSSYCETWYVDTAWWGNNPWGNGTTCDAQFIAMQDSTVPGMVYLVDLSYGSNLFYTWTFVSSDGTINQTISTQYPFINFNQFGCFNVCLTVTDTLGNCQDSFCDSVCVDSLGNLNKATNWGLTVIPSAVPVSLLLSAKEEMETRLNGTVSVFPNPASSELNLNVSLEKSETITIEVIDFTGKSVIVSNVHFKEGENNYKVDLSRFSDGIYFVKLNSGNLNYSEKVVKLQ